MLAVAVNVCALTVICAGETIFYRKFHTFPLRRERVPGGYCWQNSRCCRSFLDRSTTTSATSCRTNSFAHDGLRFRVRKQFLATIFTILLLRRQLLRRVIKCSPEPGYRVHAPTGQLGSLPPLHDSAVAR